jgi:hypothetical protein
MPTSASATITKVPDGDVSWGSKNGEEFTLSDAPNSYPLFGYPIQCQNNYNNQLAAGLTPAPVNIDLSKVDNVVPWGGQRGLIPVWDPTYQTLRIYQSAAAGNPDTELAVGADTSTYVFYLMAIGN